LGKKEEMMRGLKTFWVLLLAIALIAFAGAAFPLLASPSPSHSTHFLSGLGPLLAEDESGCSECHAGGLWQCQGNGPVFADLLFLGQTHECDACHSPSPGGGFNGVDSSKGSIGARTNWEDGVYQSNGTLTPGKGRWCAGCHDNEPAEVNGETAPDICGDNDTYGYYLGAHGNDTQGVNNVLVSNARGECVHCHEVVLGQNGPASRIIDESFEGPRYQNTWTESVGDGCSLNPDSAIPNIPPTGSGDQCLQSISDATGYKALSTLDYGSEQSRTFTRIYLYVDVDDEEWDSDDKKKIGTLDDSANHSVFIFRLYRSGVQLQFNLRLYNNSGWNDYYADISTDKWYRIELKYDTTNPGNPDAWDWKLDGENQENGDGTLAGTYYAGIQEWNLGFMNGNQDETGTIYFDQVTVDINDWVGAEPSVITMPHGGWLFATPFVDQETGFCFRCHMDPDNYIQIPMPDQYNYSNVRGGGTTLTCPDDIREAFAFIDITASPRFNCSSLSGSSHYLADMREYVKEMWGWGDVVEDIDPCMGCHNPHRAKSDWPCSKASDHENVNTWQVWGDESGENMAYYVDSLQVINAVYQPPYRYPYTDGNHEWANAGQAPDYVSLCLECHELTLNNNYSLVYSTRYGDYLGGPEWYRESGTVDVHGAEEENQWSNIGTRKPPYDGSEPNYILMCTDCHEPHGSQNRSLLRSFVNGRDKSGVFVNTDRHDTSPPTEAKNNQILEWCRACHTVEPHLMGTPGSPGYPQEGCFDCHYHGSNLHF
jgi:hypothetical protein